MNTETRFKISVPRFQRIPVDTFLFTYMMHLVTIQERPVVKDVISNIRYIVRDETGYDPFMTGTTRKAAAVKARQLFVYFCRRYTYLTFSDIGAFIGKDHATIIYAEKCVKKFRQVEKPYRDIFNSINKKVKAVIKENQN